ncbi:hypothetical protein Hanom_Chr08g00741081 [Helianthus anomalus]
MASKFFFRLGPLKWLDRPCIQPVYNTIQQIYNTIQQAYNNIQQVYNTIH